MSIKNAENLIVKDVVHGFCGRLGGVSEGIYTSLNCGLGTDDSPEAVSENRHRAVAGVAGTDLPLLTLRQDHTALCLTVNEPWAGGNRPVGDALVTDTPGLAIGVLTADCAPVLLHGLGGKGQPVIGAVHAGWKGALGGVLESAVAAMVEKGVKPERISAAIGPCIGPGSYEVSPDFSLPFLAKNPSCTVFFTAGRFDLPGYVRHRLTAAGLCNVGWCGLDTYALDKEYFSFRRSVHRHESGYGRQLSLIGISC